MKLVLAIEDRRHKDLDVFLTPTLASSYYSNEENQKAFSIGITWIWFTIGVCLLFGKRNGGFFGFYNNFGK